MIAAPKRNGTAVAQFGLSAHGVRSESLLLNIGRTREEGKLQKEIETLKLPATGKS